MIVRDALQAVPTSFDWFNDYKDTRGWLSWVALHSPDGRDRQRADFALVMLDAGLAFHESTKGFYRTAKSK